MSDIGFNATKSFLVPASVGAITPLAGEMLTKSRESHEDDPAQEFYIFHHHLKPGSGYLTAVQQLLSLDEK